MLEIKNNDLAALDALWTAVRACNLADTSHLTYQLGGTWGLAKDTFIDAATAIFDAKIAQRLYTMLIENGEDVAYQLELLVQSEICKACSQFFDDETHCTECGACPHKHHNAECYEIACQGHEPGPNEPMGITVHCDGRCRPVSDRIHTPTS